MNEVNYRFLINSMKREIKSSKKLIEVYTKDGEADHNKGFFYGEGLHQGWVQALTSKVRDLEMLLEIVEEDGNDTQRASAKPVLK